MSPTASDNTRLIELLRGYRFAQLLHVVAKLGIADRLADGPHTAAQLAASVGANPEALFRVMRALASEGIFHQTIDGTFSLTDDGYWLRSDVEQSVRGAAILYGEPWWWQAWGALSETVRTGRAAFEHVHGVGLFDYLGSHPEAAELFNGAMQLMTSRQAGAIAASFDFSTTKELVDIGGGRGALAGAILAANPRLTATIFDRPSVIQGATAQLRTLGVADRCKLVGGDFFISVPSGADTYALKDILHDWDDEQAIAILNNVRRAIIRSGRVLLIERLIPAGGEPAASKLIDVSMLVLTGGKERTESEYRTLLESAGFEVRRVVAVDAETSIVEAGVQTARRADEQSPSLAQSTQTKPLPVTHES